MLTKPSEKLSTVKASVITALLSIFAAGSAQAAVINWSSPQNISGDSDVSTDGTLVAAFNIGIPGVSSTTVNGVTFVGLGLSGNSVTSGDFNLAIATNFAGNNSVGSALAPFSTLSSAYQVLLGTEAGDFTTPITLTISNLIVGEAYEFQWWKNVSNGFLEHITTATAGNAISLSSNTSGGNEGGIGQFAIGSFTADAATQTITFSATLQDTFNAFQLRSVPEPGTLALLGLGVAGLAATRRRKQ